MGERAVERHGR